MEDGRETGRETVNHQLRVANLHLEAHCNATMPHGDFSDISGLVLFAGGVQMMGWPRASPISASPHPPPRPNPVPLAPEMLFAEVGPFKAFLPGVSADDASPELDAMIRFAGGFMVILGCMLVTVRWNTINGKLSGMAWSASPAPPPPADPPGC